MEPYDPTKDYCGPEGHILDKCISRYILGIDTNIACYEHDGDYENQIGKEKADKKYLHKMYELICAATSKWSPRRYIALTIALRRYHMVNWFGQKAYDGARRNN